MPSRKEVLKTLAIMPLGAAAGGRMHRSDGGSSTPTADKQHSATAADGDIFRSIGVEQPPVILALTAGVMGLCYAGSFFLGSIC